MAKKMKLLTVLSVLLTLISAVLYAYFFRAWLLSVTITFGTFSYHFGMRLAVGTTVNAILHNRADVTRRWFRQKGFEKKLYAVLHVRRWRDKMPTYSPDAFSVEKHTYDEIAQAMCQAELVHEIIALLSFLPLATVPWLGAFPVFLATSALAAGYDLLFVILQRYNRPIVLRAAELEKRRRSGLEETK